MKIVKLITQNKELLGLNAGSLFQLSFVFFFNWLIARTVYHSKPTQSLRKEVL